MSFNPEALLEALDPEQREVATRVRGPLAVLAGAGTGKTRAITYRLAYGAAIDAFDPATVLAVTYTSRAAAEMRSRLRVLGVQQASARTFHSAALLQLRHFWPLVIGGYMPKVLEHKASLVAAACSRLGVSVDRSAVRDIAAEIEWAKVSMIGAQEYIDALNRALREPPAGLDASEMATLLEVYEDAKDERNAIDFEDVLLLMVGMMHERDDVARQVRARYRHFVVDEFQDVSALEFELLNQWLGDRHDVCVVGDVAQTIYSFAGADPHYLVTFASHHPGAHVVELHRDYRSTPQIVTIANRILEAPVGRYHRQVEGIVRLQSQRESGPAVRFDLYRDDTHEAESIVQRIRSLQDEGIALEDIAILYRTNSQSEAFEAALAAAGIGFSVRGGQKFFEREEVRRTLVILRQMARTSSEAITGEAMIECVKGVVSEQGWTVQPPSTIGAMRQRWDSLDALVNLAYDRASLSLQQLVDELFERSEAQLAPTTAEVTLSSLHAAKGLEWEAVFLAGVSDGLIPISLARGNDAIEEEKRLLYVGVTRAKTHLYVSYARSRTGRSGNRKQSRFLNGIWPLAEPVVVKRTPPAHTPEDVPAEVQGLFDELKQWRTHTASELSQPAFMILTDQTLLAIADAKPRTLVQLGAIRGIGQVKLERFGSQLLAIVRQAIARE